MKTTEITGRTWLLTDNSGHLIEDIDTDMIFHNAHLHITDISQMGRFALGNLEGWQDFPLKAQPGDILIAGRNFGAGSSRQQAVDCFKALQTALMIAPSFGAIYFRNAVNSGFPVLCCPDLSDLVSQGMQSGDNLSLDVLNGRGKIEGRPGGFDLEPMSQVQYAIWQAGGLFAYARSLSAA
jgi:3-isopropylmalate/(R)-2-methylmalate dehydratase small subunit